MKKLAPLIIFSLLFFGCSKETEQPANDTSLISEPEMEEILTNGGWDIQSTSAASFHLWDQLNPTILLLAENSSEQVMVIGEFEDSKTAELAYESALPLKDSSVTISDTDEHLQALIPLGDDEGYWLFRQAGKCVMGGWMQDPSSQEEYESIFNSFQTNAPVQKDETHVPTDSKPVSPDSTQNADSQDDAFSDDGTAQAEDTGADDAAAE